MSITSLTFFEASREQPNTKSRRRAEDLDAVCDVCGLRIHLDIAEMGLTEAIHPGEEFCACDVWEPSGCEGTLIVQLSKEI